MFIVLLVGYIIVLSYVFGKVKFSIVQYSSMGTYICYTS